MHQRIWTDRILECNCACRRALELDPEFVDIMPTYGLLLYQQRSFEAAAEWLSQAITRLKTAFRRGQYVAWAAWLRLGGGLSLYDLLPGRC